MGSRNCLLIICVSFIKIFTYSIKSKFTVPNDAANFPPATSTHYQLSRKLDEVLHNDVVTANKIDLTGSTVNSKWLKDLQSSLNEQSTISSIQSIQDLQAPSFWLQSFAEKEWETMTITEAESIFYWIVDQSFNFKNGIDHLDPFSKLKLNKLNLDIPFIEDVSTRLLDLLECPSNEAVDRVLRISVAASHHDDITISHADATRPGEINASPGARRQRFSDGLNKLSEFVVVNDASRVYSVLEKAQKDPTKSRRNVDFIVGNVGKDIFSDLITAHLLLVNRLCDTVTFHCKKYSVGSLSALGVDVIGHIDYLTVPTVSDIWAVRHLGDTLQTHVQLGEFKFMEDEYWCQSTPFWEMPDSMQELFNSSVLVFVKGDMNYRRLLGDRAWPLETEASAVLNYWPVPLCALRTVESDIGVGVSVEQQRRIEAVQSDWMQRGQWDFIQLGCSTE